MSPEKRPIAIFDSGLGGLTVFQAIKRLLPHENIIYLADNQRVPYGPLPSETILQYTKEAVLFLEKQNVKMVVLACHTASVCALHETFSLPVHGVVQGAIQAMREVSGFKKIGILGTEKTIQSGVYERALPKEKTLSVACPKLAGMIEAQEGNFEEVIREYIKPLQKEGVDAVFLGCTHYPLILHVFEKILGKQVRLLDSSEKTALEVKEKLEREKMLNRTGKPVYQFYVTKDAKTFGTKASFFLQEEVIPQQLQSLLEL